MRFWVTTSIDIHEGTEGALHTQFVGEYELLANGAIRITPDDGETLTYSPSFWICVRDVDETDGEDVLEGLLPDEPFDASDI